MSICKLCKKQVISGEPIHGVTLNHWTCEKAQTIDVKADLRAADTAMRALGLKAKIRRSPAGEGRIGKKLTAFLVAALEEENGGKVTKISLWNQPVGCRGPLSDLAYWGGSAKFDGGDRPVILFHSWSTMTACVKAGQITLYAEDNEFDILPGKTE
jgi:hypothetical protein